jgi:hypothetical protein
VQQGKQKMYWAGLLKPYGRGATAQIRMHLVEGLETHLSYRTLRVMKYLFIIYNIQYIEMQI